MMYTTVEKLKIDTFSPEIWRNRFSSYSTFIRCELRTDSTKKWLHIIIIDNAVKIVRTESYVSVKFRENWSNCSKVKLH